MYPIKQNTAITVPFFVHDANGDGVTGLVDSGFTKRISKNGGAFAAMTVTISELENGWYSLPLDTGHTDTLGLLTISISHASAKRVNLQFRVHARLPDDLAFPATSGRSLQVEADGMVHADLKEWLGSAPNVLVAGRVDSRPGALANDVITAPSIASGAIDRAAFAADTGLQSIRSGTAQGGAAGTITLDAGASATDDFYTDAFVLLTGGTGAGQCRLISDYVGSTKVATVTPNWVTAPDATSTFAILPMGRVDLALWLGATINALISGRVDVSVGAMATDVLTASALATDAVNEIRDSILSDSTPFPGANINASISSRATPAQVNAEVLDVLSVDTFAELTAVPAANSPLSSQINWLFLLARNKITQTATTQTLRNDADTASIATASVSDDGTTFTRNEWV
ncbi:MAG TPA: hypothetical protein VNP04_21550 [Alphaproteobacteria bacterium]|nr:hypothetical protein [Alphaproteobacteria bacterium]